MGDYLVTFCASIHSLGSGSQVYGPFLGEFLASYGDKVDDEHSSSSPEGRLVRKDHPDIKGHATGMCP